MIAFLDNNLRHHEGVAAVGPCDGLGPAAVVKELPAGCVRVVDAPVDLERLAGIWVFRLALDADGFGGLQAPGLVSGIPKQNDGVNLGLADCGLVRTGDQALGGVILLGVLRRDRGNLIGVLPVFSKGYVRCDFIAAVDQPEILIAVVNGACAAVLDQDRLFNGCQVVRSGDSGLCDFEMGGEGIHGAAGGRFQHIIDLCLLRDREVGIAGGVLTGPLYKFIAGVGSRLAGQGNVAVDIELLKARFYAAHSGVGGNVLDKDLLVVGDLIGRIAVLAAAELIFSPDGVESDAILLG